MFKKNSWIVALLLALALTALFTGCIDALVPEDVEYDEVELGDFNVWGGQNYQRGWAVAGMKFLGVSDKPEVAADKGYENEDFAKATKLVIEMKDSSHPSGALDIIWGGADENGDSIGYDWVQTGGIPFTKEGNVITIDLKAMKQYANYRDPTIAKRKLVLQAGGESEGLKDLVVKAKLLIPLVEEPVPPDPNIVPGDGSYKLPTNLTLTREEFLVDLNGAYQGAFNKVILPARLEANRLTFTLTGNDNRAGIYIPFTADFARLTQAAADAGYKITVTIDGSATASAGKSIRDFRWFITNNDSSNYGTTNLVGNDSSYVLTGDLTFFNQNRTVKGFALQCTGDSDTTGTDIVINYIKFKFVAPAVTPPEAITSAQSVITMIFPAAGWGVSSAIDSSGVSGSVKFIPEPVFGKFEKSTVYYAEITVTPKAGVFIPFDTTFKIENLFPGAEGMNDDDIDQASYDPVKGIIYTKAFSSTDSTDSMSPLDGYYDDKHGTFTQEAGSTIKFNLSGAGGYIATNFPDAVSGTVVITNPGQQIKKPLADSQADKYEFVNDGLNISERKGDSWRAIDLHFTGEDSLGLDFTTKSYKVTVWGNLLGTPPSATKATMHVPYSASPWQSSDIGDSGNLTNAFEKFEMSGTITPANWTAWTAQDAEGINRIRIRVENGNLAFRISRITVEELQ